MQAPSGAHAPLPWHIVVFLAPAVLIYTVFMIYPLVDTLRLASSRRTRATGEIFVGLQQLRPRCSPTRWSPQLLERARNNVIFFIIHMLVQNPIGIALAALLEPRACAVAPSTAR